MFLSSLEELMWLPHQLMSTSGTMRSNMSTRQENGCFLLLCHAQIYSICIFCKERFHKLINFLFSCCSNSTTSISELAVAHLHIYIVFRCTYLLFWGPRTRDVEKHFPGTWMFPGVEVQSEGSWCVRAKSWMSRSRGDGVVLFFDKCTF